MVATVTLRSEGAVSIKRQNLKQSLGVAVVGGGDGGGCQARKPAETGRVK